MCELGYNFVVNALAQALCEVARKPFRITKNFMETAVRTQPLRPPASSIPASSVSRSLALIIALLMVPEAHAEIDARLSLGTHYVYRGLNQAGDGPVLQGTLAYSNPAGWFGGVWASNVEFPWDDRSHEVDYFLGYQRHLNDAVAVDATLIRSRSALRISDSCT